MTAAAARRPRPGHGAPRLIGHRGACGLAPENTFVSFRKAAEIGVRWIEFDVHLSSDGVPVVIHDDTLERTTSGKGPVAERSMAELAALDAGTWFGPEFAGEHVPTLEATIALLGKLDMSAVVEIKPSPGFEAVTAEAAVRLVAARWPETLQPPIISSFERESLIRAHEVAPGLTRALLVHALPDDWQAQVEELGCSAIHASQRHLTAAGVQAVTKAGLPLFAYTVNQPERAAQLYRWGVAAIFTDRPDLMLEIAHATAV